MTTCAECSTEIVGQGLYVVGFHAHVCSNRCHDSFVKNQTAQLNLSFENDEVNKSTFGKKLPIIKCKACGFPITAHTRVIVDGGDFYHKGCFFHEEVIKS